jgi:hypothetical protein
MTLVHRKGALNEADPLSRRPDFVPHAIIPLFGMASFRQIKNYDGGPSRC